MAAIQKVVAGVARPGGPVVLVGHEPDLGKVVSRLAGLRGARFKKCGAAELEWGADGRAALVSWLPPRILRKLARVAG